MKVYVVDAFIDGAQGGNAAGVVLDSDQLNPTHMQAIAAEMGLSETVFMSRSESAEFRTDFFTPNKRVPDCGHATVAAFSLLSAENRLRGTSSSKETVDGVREIILEGDSIFMAQRAPVFTPTTDRHHAIAASLGISPDGFLAPPEVVNTGVNFLMIALKNEAAVKELEPNQEAIAAISDELDLIGYYVFSTQASKEGRHAGARMFAPSYGIPEESATGMAAGPCACYLNQRLGVTDETIYIEQGRMMETPSPSLLTVRLEISDKAITGLRVGGIGKVNRTVDIESLVAHT